MLVLFLCFLPLALAGYIPGKKCGGVVCLDDEDIQCFPQYNYCRCRDGLWGNGRFACVERSSTCLCYLFGDPYITAFSGSVMAAPIPCRHILTEFTTPSGVYVKVAATGGNRDDKDYPGFVMEDEVFFRASKGKTTAHADIRRSGFYNKGLKVPLPVADNFPDFGLTVYGEFESHYWRLELPRHAVAIRYRSADSSITIQTPKGSTFVKERLCGQCSDGPGQYEKEASAMDLTKKEWSFYKQAFNLDTKNEDRQVCIDFDAAVKATPEDKQAAGLKFCGAPFSHNDIGSCFTEAFGKPNILQKTVACLTDFTAGKTSDWCAAGATAKSGCSNKKVDFSIIESQCK
ncbi:uncharacterized protein LOC126822130 [Patella vulgata]|uniref:uncharacterized protein LOC126822130 n=1 Tax=Patella vulgata TaxID=6465 RepID=UPI00217F6015|nr:uncharacterized protein LOC126822130 [Patella vulgata]